MISTELELVCARTMQFEKSPKKDRTEFVNCCWKVVRLRMYPLIKCPMENSVYALVSTMMIGTFGVVATTVAHRLYNDAEASHAAPRILHYADQTGMIITKHITQAAIRHPLITLQSQTLVTDVIDVPFDQGTALVDQ